MMSRLTGKVAVVTGASKGIGAAIAERFGEEGASVVVHYSSDRQGAEKVLAAIEKAGGKAVAVQADLSKPDQVAKIFEEAAASFGGKINVLVNNAGIFEFRPLAQIDAPHFHRQFDLNVLGLLLTTQEAVKRMNGGGGSIINISSVVGDNGVANGAVYSATKAAVDAITQSLAKELGPHGIRVNSLQPGPTATEGFRAMANSADFEKTAPGQTPLGRLGQAADIAGAALFLATEDSGWVTGTEIPVSGGLRT
jgi:3-oxoacyl-[acyl-carrier protein] reductase